MSQDILQYCAFLRGINVGGHHKVPMNQLKEMMEGMGFTKVKTFLNSGNLVLESGKVENRVLEEKIASALQLSFGFAIPITIRSSETIKHLITDDPFHAIQLHKDIRCYVTFLNSETAPAAQPYTSEDRSFEIIKTTAKEVYSVLNVSKYKTTDAMKILETSFGKNITTRNWNTILKIGAFLKD